MTWVSLATKIEDATEIKDYRVIIMIGCIYKVVAIVLANKMKHVLPKLVGDTQMMFVHGRQILDGALIANKLCIRSKGERKKQ